MARLLRLALSLEVWNLKRFFPLLFAILSRNREAFRNAKQLQFCFLLLLDDCFQSDRWCRIDFLLWSRLHIGNRVKLLQLSVLNFTAFMLQCRRFSCDGDDEWRPNERKIVKTYPARQKLCSRIVVQYQQSADFLLFFMRCNVLKPCFAFATANTFRYVARLPETETNKHKAKSTIFQYCLLFSFATVLSPLICLLKICSFWNYYFICIVWEPPCFAVVLGCSLCAVRFRYRDFVIAWKFPI